MSGSSIRVKVITQTGVLNGHLKLPSARVIDLLNDPRTGFLTINQAKWRATTAVMDPVTPTITVAKAAVLVLIPVDDHPSLAAGRAHTDSTLARIFLPGFCAFGRVQIAPGDPRTLRLLLQGYSRTFLPCTEVTISRVSPEHQDEDVAEVPIKSPVAFINTASVLSWSIENGEGPRRTMDHPQITGQVAAASVAALASEVVRPQDKSASAERESYPTNELYQAREVPTEDGPRGCFEILPLPPTGSLAGFEIHGMRTYASMLTLERTVAAIDGARSVVVEPDSDNMVRLFFGGLEMQKVLSVLVENSIFTEKDVSR